MINQNNLIEHMRAVAEQYVPEWVLDEKNPDLGTAFALTFAELIKESFTQLDTVMDKHENAFVSFLGLEQRREEYQEKAYMLLPLEEGEKNGKYLPANTSLEGEEASVFQTTEDLYLTNAGLSAVYMTDGSRDQIFHLSDGTPEKPWDFSQLRDEDNLQRHNLYLCYTSFFDHFSNHMKLALTVETESGFELLLDPDVVGWSYYCEDYIPFAAMEAEGNTIYFTMQEGTSFQKTALTGTDGKEGYVIRCQSRQTEKTKDIVLMSAKLRGVRADAGKILPLHLYHQDMELLSESYRPFGNSLSLGDDFYISCEKLGTSVKDKIKLQVSVRFDELALNEIYYQYLEGLLHKDLTRPKIQIDQASISYWNGKDFMTLPLQDQDSLGKLLKEDDQKDFMIRSICFDYPEDMALGSLNGVESMWIRIRIHEIVHLYEGFGTLCIPVFENMNFFVTSSEEGSCPDYWMIENNTEIRILDGKQKPAPLFEPLEIKTPCLYFGFQAPFQMEPKEEVPIGILWELSSGPKIEGLIKGFYLSTEEGWELCKVRDGTEGFRHSGILRFYSKASMSPSALFQEELFWLRIDCHAYDSRLPLCIHGFGMNAVSVKQLEGQVELIEPQEEWQLRTKRTIRHCGRAVTAGDFESLSYEAAGFGVLKSSRCFAQEGRLTIVYLPAAYDENGEVSYEIAHRIEQYLQTRGDPLLLQRGGIQVREADYVEISVKAEIWLNEKADVLEGRRYLEQAIRQFLDPVQGKADQSGYKIGELPVRKELFSFLQTLPMVFKIKSLFLIGENDEEDKRYAVPQAGSLHLELRSAVEAADDR